MRVEQRQYLKEKGWKTLSKEKVDRVNCSLVLVFGDKDILKEEEIYYSLKAEYPIAEIVLCSTAGEIMDIEVFENTVSLVALQFEKTVIQTAKVEVDDFDSSFQAGYDLATQLPKENLKSVLLISDGQHVNGSELIMAINEFLPPNTIVTGGMAGDGSRFQGTLVGLNEVPIDGRIVAIGFYGEFLKVTSGSVGGWDTFGVERLITRSKKNILFELDGKPALDIYKLYLGVYASDLPASALFFPVALKMKENHKSLVRTILGIDEKEKSVIFAGNMPEGTYAQLMKANPDRLIDGAGAAAEESMLGDVNESKLALLISCIGRKIVLNHRVDEEVEIIRAVLGEKTALVGFYSYGEFAPSKAHHQCELHNQTMTITVITEG